MKKFLNYVMIFALLMIITTSVNAQEIYYENSYGITFTKEEYDFFSKMYYDGYQANMTEDDMKIFEGRELNPDNVVSSTYVDKSFNPGAIQTRATYHETQAKILKISKSGVVDPLIAITAQWKYAPNVRSYDLIGAFFSGNISLITGTGSKVSYAGGSTYPSAETEVSNGFGSVLLLPANGRDIVVSSTFIARGSGTIFGSYQHAKKTISLNDAKSFSISYSGIGNVFYFSNMNIRAKYDAMQGVSVSI
ncbi:MAG: hypothetical protein E7159_01635 [Firmicutes bacterium]|nr:hypothetical protein [Bacillota bacterium]